MTNKTIYYRKTKSDSLLGGWKMQKVVRKAHNRKGNHAQRFFTNDRCWTFGMLIGTMAGSLYLQTLGQDTIHFINSASAQETSEITTSTQPEQTSEGVEAAVITNDAGQTQPLSASQSESELIELAIDEFLPTHKSEALMIMHCLAHREARHGESTGHGDNGLAGGPFQFHQATWDGYRKLMNEEPSSRYDFKESARTTAWAISTGRATAWGPILRKSKGNDYASCPVPTWYK